MNVETFRAYCLSKRGITEEFPFDEETLVFKVMGRMFALCGLEHNPLQIALKCNPERAIELREQYDGRITEAWHMSKKHWNSVHAEALPEAFVKELIDHSYELVVAGLTKKQQQELQNL